MRPMKTLFFAPRYLIPRPAVLGAIPSTGYLHEAVANHVRAGAGFFEILLRVIFAIVMWGWLFLRDPRLCALIPVRRMS